MLYLFGGNPSSEKEPSTRLEDFWSLHLQRYAMRYSCMSRQLTRIQQSHTRDRIEQSQVCCSKAEVRCFLSSTSLASSYVIRFIELCATQPSLVALQYLQTSLASVVGKDAEQVEAFQQCMQYLLSAPAISSDEMDMDGQPPSLASSKDNFMASSQDLPLPLSPAQASERFWEHRTRLFEELLQFFPRGAIAQQPVQELVSLIH